MSKSEGTLPTQDEKHSYTVCDDINLVRAINTEVVESIGRKINGDESKCEP